LIDMDVGGNRKLTQHPDFLRAAGILTRRLLHDDDETRRQAAEVLDRQAPEPLTRAVIARVMRRFRSAEEPVRKQAAAALVAAGPLALHALAAAFGTSRDAAFRKRVVELLPALPAGRPTVAIAVQHLLLDAYFDAEEGVRKAATEAFIKVGNYRRYQAVPPTLEELSNSTLLLTSPGPPGGVGGWWVETAATGANACPSADPAGN
jgi:hypothetical protein